MAKTLPNREALELLALKALKLRTAGMEINDIAKELGQPTGKVKDAITRAMTFMRKNYSETAEEARQLELARLDALLAMHFPHILTPRHAELVLKIMERRARFLGLDTQPENKGEDIAEGLRQFLAGAKENTGIQES